MKVYSWQGFRRGPGIRPGGVTTREIVCAKSKREARALQGVFRVPLLEIGESAQPEEIAMASARPGVVFWRDIDRRSPHAEWTAVEPKEKR